MRLDHCGLEIDRLIDLSFTGVSRAICKAFVGPTYADQPKFGPVTLSQYLHSRADARRGSRWTGLWRSAEDESHADLVPPRKALYTFRQT